MKLPSILVFIVSIFIHSLAWAAPAQIILWDSPEGIKRLDQSRAKVDFFPLANAFESQENKIYCGLASSAIVLNALRLNNPDFQKPMSYTLAKDEQRYLPTGFNPLFERYTQNNVLLPQAKTKSEILGKPVTINGKEISDYGLQLDQLTSLLKGHKLKVTTRIADNTISDDTIRKELITNLQTAGDYALVNYSRKVLGQGDTGHISPLGAYDKASDSFLVLDVNPNVSKWAWVKADDLITAMRTFDVISNRGYVLVSEGEK